MFHRRSGCCSSGGKIWNRKYGLVNNAGINIPRLLVDKNHPHGPYELLDEVFDKIVAINQGLT